MHRRFVLPVLVALLAAALVPAPAAAHDIPGEARLHAFLKPEGERLHVLVRVPLALLLNLDVPKRGPGYIDLAAVGAALPRAVAATDKDLELFEDGRRLTVARWSARISAASDRSFESYEKARALLAGPPLPEATDVFWNQGYFDAAIEYEIRSPRASFSLDFHVSPAMGDRLKLDVRHVSPDGVVRAYELPTGAGEVVLDPRWHQAAWSFVRSGFAHILDGLDHLLFLLCLVLPFRRIGWRLAGMVTSFTAAHSVTLIAAAYGLVPRAPWFPALVEALIAVSILYTAIENVVRPRIEGRWIVAGLFGLVHGFGFSFVLGSQLQFAGSHLLLSLVAFNVGIELGQLLALALAVPALVLLQRVARDGGRLVTIVPSLLVAHVAWHWAAERAEALKGQGWPFETAPTELALPVLAAAAAGGAAFLAVRQLRRRAATSAGARSGAVAGGR
jgi:hypothetical protein